MKEDVKDLPDKIPHKRRQIEQILDIHIAMWLDSDIPTPSERRKLEEEKKRRKGRQVPVTVGFLGADEGLSPAQKDHIIKLLSETENVVETHIGDEYGGDLQVHKICVDNGFAPIVVHPQDNKAKRAFLVTDRTEKVKSFIEAKKDIVRSSSLIIATPREGVEPTNYKESSSIWEAIRYARSRSSNLKVIMPDGTVL